MILFFYSKLTYKIKLEINIKTNTQNFYYLFVKRNTYIAVTKKHLVLWLYVRKIIIKQKFQLKNYENNFKIIEMNIIYITEIKIK